VNAFHDCLFITAPRERLALIRRLAIPVHAKTHRICFTHADLNPTNILVKDGKLAGLIDWQFSGWYPEYWEYTQLEFRTERAKAEHAFWKAVHLFDEEQYQQELLLEHGFWGPDKLFKNDL
jgi:predicted unusual protein kinase regulating ubiquinone biosynthesis (AarF/ABC1/UbiB family)